ncbi:hypothetical protein GQ457_05G011520 [Hibiscus cannabinus]
MVEDVAGLQEKEIILENDTLGTSRDVTSKGKQLDGTITDDTLTEGKHLDGTISDVTVIQANHLEEESVEADEKTIEDVSAKLKLQDFLLEEKRRELEKLAKDQEEEQRTIEAEKAANKADIAQAKVEIRQEILEQLMKKGARLVDNIWFIEPNEFKEADKVKLCYDKTPGPLAHANELWVHGGHNNWRDGLTIVGKLVRSEGEGGGSWGSYMPVSRSGAAVGDPLERIERLACGYLQY